MAAAEGAMRILVPLVYVVLTAGPGFAAGVDLELCRQLPRHIPDPGVAYTPGVDVGGKPVVPADLPGRGSRRLGFEMPVTLDLAKQLGFDVPTNAPGNTQVGKLTIENGKTLFNGRPLNSRNEAGLAAACGNKR